MAGTITPTTFNGHDISSSSVYDAVFVRDSSIGDVFESQQVTADVTGNFPQYVLGQPQGRVLMLRIKMPGAAKTYANLKQLKQWFNARNDEVTLAATNENSDSLTLTVKPLGLSPVDGFDGYWDAKLWASMPIWKNATATDTTQNVAVDSASWSVTNAGSDSVKPRLTLTAKAQKTAGNGPASQRRVVVANRSTKALLDGNGNPWPIEITNGGWDATTKIKAASLHPQGYDTHVLIDGVEVNRYLSNWGAGYGDASATGSAVISSTGYYAQRFRLPGCSSQETNTINEVGFYLKKSGTPTGTMVYKIRADNAGTPGSIVTNGTSPATANVSTLTTSFAFFSATYSSKPVLNANTWYWLEADTSGVTLGGGSIAAANTQATTATGDWQGMYEGQSAGIRSSTDESSWSNPFPITIVVLSFRVYVNGNAKVWVPMALEAAATRTLGTGLASGNPPLHLAESGGAEGLPENTAWLLDSEVKICRGKVGTDAYHITTNGVRGTTQALHTGGIPIYLLQNYVQLIFNDNRPNVLTPTGYEPSEFSPCIDGVQSTNTSFVWPGPFIATPTRPMSWRPVLDSSVALSSTISLDNDATNDLTDVTFKDAAVAGSYINRNVIEQRFPVPIKNGSSAVTIDEANIPAALSVQHLLTNQDGAEAVVATHRASDSGTGKTITTTALQYRYRIRALNEAIVGCETNDTSDSHAIQLGTNNLHGWYQTFVLDEDSTITSIAFRLKWNTAVDASKTVNIAITNVNSTTGVPLDGSTRTEYVKVTGVDISTGFSAGTYKTVSGTFATPAALKAGTYAIAIDAGAVAAFTNTCCLSAAGSAFARGAGYWDTTGAPAADGALDYWFRIFGTAAVQVDSPSATGSTCNIDNIICALDTSTAPQVIFESSDQTIVYLTPTITVQHPAGYGADNSLGLTAVMKVNGNLDIDFDAKTITNDDTDLTNSSCPFVVTSVDELDPYRLEPGSNTITYAETGQTGSGVDVRHRFWGQYL